MPYVALADLAGRIAPLFAAQALDDNGDGAADSGLWDLIAQQVSDEIDGRLGQRYTVPFTAPVPAIVTTAARIFAAEALYGRRVTPEQNPWAKQAEMMRSKLDAIAQGTQPLMPGKERAQPSATIITEPGKTFSRTGRMAI